MAVHATWPSSITPGTELEVRVCEDGACTPWSAVDVEGPSVSLAPWKFQIGVVIVTEEPSGKLCAGFPPGYDQPAHCLSALAKAGYDFADQARLKWSLRARSADAPFLEFEKVVNAVLGNKPRCSDPAETCRYSETVYYVDPALTR